MNRLALAIGLAVASIAVTGANAADPVGIAACDDFLTKYEACVTTKIPAAQQPAFKTQLEQVRKSWSDAAKNPSVRPTLESSCKQTGDQLKASLASYGCTF